MNNEERRHNTRIPAEFIVNYIHDGDYVISLSKDISADGMFIHTDNPPPVGDTPTLVFSIGALHDVSVLSQVMWVNTRDNGLDRGMGVQFLNIPDKLRETVLRIVNKVAVFDPEDKSVN